MTSAAPSIAERWRGREATRASSERTTAARRSEGAPGAAVACDQQGGFGRAPRTRCVGKGRRIGIRPGVEDHLYETPCRLDRIAPHEERLIARDDVAQQGLVSLGRRSLVVEIDIDGV